MYFSGTLESKLELPGTRLDKFIYFDKVNASTHAHVPAEHVNFTLFPTDTNRASTFVKIRFPFDG